jgi:gliding motility-associated-like protein
MKNFIRISTLIGGLLTPMLQLAQCPFDATTSVQHATCYGKNDGAASATPTTGNPPYSYSWTGMPWVTGNAATNLAAGVYQVFITDNAGCVIQVQMTVNQPPRIGGVITAPSYLCIGDTAQLSITASGGVPPYTYLWECNNLDCRLSSFTSPITSAWPGVPTQYKVQVRDSNNCVNYPDSVDIGIRVPPTVVASDDQSIYLGETADLDVSVSIPGGQYSWSPAANLTDFTLQAPVAKPAITTVYRVEYVDPFNCKGSDTTKVTVIPDFFIANALTPDGDGKNDVWIVKGLIPYPEARVDVFNKWGDRVFSSKGYPIPWDGTYSGRMLPYGTYFYVIDLSAYNLDPYQGVIHLVK